MVKCFTDNYLLTTAVAFICRTVTESILLFALNLHKREIYIGNFPPVTLKIELNGETSKEGNMSF